MHSSPESWKSFPPLPPPSPTPTKNCSKVSPTSVPAFAKPRSNAVSASPLPQPPRPNSSRPHSSRTNSRRPSSSQPTRWPLALRSLDPRPRSSSHSFNHRRQLPHWLPHRMAPHRRITYPELSAHPSWDKLVPSASKILRRDSRPRLSSRAKRRGHHGSPPRKYIVVRKSVRKSAYAHISRCRRISRLRKRQSHLPHEARSREAPCQARLRQERQRLIRRQR